MQSCSTQTTHRGLNDARCFIVCFYGLEIVYDYAVQNFCQHCGDNSCGTVKCGIRQQARVPRTHDSVPTTNALMFQFPTCVEGFKIQIGQPVKTVHSSKFCLGRLLRIRNQVREIARKEFQHSPSNKSDICYKNAENAVASERLDQESELSQQLRKAYPRNKLVILNYKEKLWTSMEGGNEEAERNAFWDIMDAIDNMWRDENLLLQGYPMLTQFNVGIVYMLCHLFNKVSEHCIHTVPLFWCGKWQLCADVCRS